MTPSGGARRRLPLDAVVALFGLLLVAREAVLFQPTRELFWQLAHDARVDRRSAWLGALRPDPGAWLDLDPLALLLGGLAVALALAYLALALRGARPRARAGVLALAALLLVALPTLAFVGLGQAMRLPYGHDGGVVQLPLALDKVLAGESPYQADYSRSVLGRQSRASEFWAPLGGNPITRHHWYLPGVHVVMIPPYLLSRALLGFFDPRLVTLLGWALAALLAARLAGEDAEARLAAAALVLLHPLAWWPQIFGVNDVLSAVPLLLAGLALQRGRPRVAAAWVGAACAFKQLCWPFAPFLLVLAAGLQDWRELLRPAGWRRLAAPVSIALAVAAALVVPIASRDWGAFYADIFRYQVGLPGADQYPFGGTPGFGLANLLIYRGAVQSLGEPYPMSRFYALFVPVGLLLLRALFRAPRVSTALLCGSAALLTSVWLSRIPNPNYLLLAALLAPLAVLIDRRWPADVAVVPLLLLALATEHPVRELLRSTWQACEALGTVPGLPAALWPVAGGPRWRDPLSLAVGALAAGLGLAYLVAALAGAGRRLRQALILASALLVVGLPAWVALRTSAATAIAHAQDPWLAEAWWRPGPVDPFDGHAAPAVREAWSPSLRKLEAEAVSAEAATPHQRLLRGTLAAVGLVDARWLAGLGLLLATWLAMRRAPAELRPTVMGVLLLLPAGAVGLAFGSGAPLVLGLLLATLALASSQRLTAAGPVAGLAGGLFPPLGWAAGSLLPARGRLAALFGAALVLLAPWLFAFVATPAHAWHALSPELTPFGTAGLLGLLAYGGAERSTLARGIVTAAQVALVLGVPLLAARARMADEGRAALLALAGLALVPAAPHLLFVPLVLALLAALPDPP